MRYLGALFIGTLVLGGLTSVASAQRVTSGLQVLYGFTEGVGTVVEDISGVGSPLDLTISDSNAVNWLPGSGLVLESSVVVGSSGPATKIINACQATQAVTVEAWVEAANTSQSGPARIVAHSQDGGPNGGNFILGQSGSNLEARLRTTATNQYGKPALVAPGMLDTELRHLVYTRDATGARALYVDGMLANSSSIGGTYANWGDYPLTLGNEPPGDRPWLGTLYLVAVYDRALDVAEVGQNFAVGPTVNETPQPPVIVTQPVDQTVTEGQTATFSVQASGTPPLAYQWQRDGLDITGATSSSYTTPPVTLADDGDQFQCTVSNALGNVTSATATLTVQEAGARVTAGLQVLYGFGEGGGATVQDVSGVGVPIDLTISDLGAVTWLPGGGLVLDSSVVVGSSGPTTKIINACHATQAVTVEAWVEAANTSQSGPARIVAHSQDGGPNGGNFILGQSGSSLEARLRTTATNQYGKPALVAPGMLDTELRHLVYTRDATGARALYVDGVLANSSSIGGTYANWGDYPLILGNEPPGDRPWLGTLYLVAVYDRALDVAEVGQNFAVGPTVNVTPQPPVIVTQPVDQTVTEGQTATFSVVASGTGTLLYQWQRDLADIAGATGSSYTTLPLTLADSGASFRCLVTNEEGTTASDPALLTVLPPQPPVILTQPVDQTVTEGQTATFSVEASGTGTLMYQWQRDLVDIAGATSSSYTTLPLTLADSGASFRCMVTDDVGTTASDPAILTVLPPQLPVILTQPVDQTVTEGQTATFSVEASGTGTLMYQWQRDLVDIAGATSSSYTTLPLTLADSGASFRCMVTDDVGTTASDPATLTVLEPSPRVTSGLQVLYGFTEGVGTVVEDISGVGSPLDLTISDSNAVNWLPGGGLVLESSVVVGSSGPATKIINACQVTQAVTVEAWVEAANTSQSGPARIVAHSQDGGPNGGNFILGQSGSSLEARLRTTATNQYGKPALVAPGMLDTELRHLVYTRDATGARALYVDGVLANSSSIGGTYANWGDYPLILGNEPPGDRPWLGTLYLVAVYDRALDVAEVGQNFAVGPTVNVTPQPPVIVTQPVDQTVTEGQTATFSVVASGTGTLLYQWQRDLADIAGATGSSYTTLPLTLADSGASFRCLVTNEEGTTASDPALLTVLPPQPPVIVTQPVDQTVTEGQTATFSVEASGTGTLMYQWQRDLVDIAGATSSSYTTLPLTLADSGASFRCMVTDDVGTTASDPAILTVLVPSPRVRVTSGQIVLYGFSEGAGQTIADVSGTGTPLNLTIMDESGVNWIPGGGLAVNSPTLISSILPASKVIDAVKAKNEITLEVWVSPGNTTQNGPARIVTCSADPSHRNFTLGQGIWNVASDAWDFRLRTTLTDDNGIPSLSTAPGTLTSALTHVVYTRNAAGSAKIFVDGVESVDGIVGGSFINWDSSYTLTLANELTDERPWLGEFYMVAIFDRALSPVEIQQNLTAGPHLGSLVSDDFNHCALNTELWTFIDPYFSAGYELVGGSGESTLQLSIPAGQEYSAWGAGGTNNSLRIMQSASDEDFEVEVNFNTVPSSNFHDEGIIVEQDSQNWLTFDVFHDSGELHLLVSNIIDGLASTHADVVVPTGPEVYLRTSRMGDNWTFLYSTDGGNWIQPVSTLNHPLTVNQVGVYAANPIESTAFSTDVDYFFNTIIPIVPEDGDQITLSVNTVGDGNVIVNPDQSSYLCGDAVELTANPANGWDFVSWSGDLSGNENPIMITMDGDKSVTALFQSPNSVISVWYGQEQSFGQLGTPQRWVNILGNVFDSDGVSSLTYSLNGGPAVSLRLGPEVNGRLTKPGDFNADLATDALLNGQNTLLLTATDDLGNVSAELVTINYESEPVWPMPYSIDWSGLGSVEETQDVAQVVDGKWILESGNLRTAEPGYDRLVAVGDTTWTDYEVTVPITIHQDFSRTACGILLRWEGHTDDPVMTENPKSGWFPLGAILWYRQGRLQIYGNQANILDQEDFSLTLGQTYWFKARVETIPGVGGLYRLKVWEVGQPEPGDWDLTGQDTMTDPQAGSAVLVAHYTDASFGNVTISGLSGASDYPPFALTDSDIVLTGNSVQIDVLANDSDVDGILDSTTVQILNPPIHGSTVVDPVSGIVTYFHDGSVTSSDSFTYSVNDNEGNASAETMVTLSVVNELPAAVVSDDFNQCDLNRDLWTFVNPSNAGAYVISGAGGGEAVIELSVPDGVEHNAWGPNGLNEAPRIMQPTLNDDMEFEVKFNTVPSADAHNEGVVIEQDANNWIRFDVYNNGTQLWALAGSTISGTTNTYFNMPVVTGSAVFLKVNRAGNTWSFWYSNDGTNWSQLGGLETQALTLSQVGVFCANPRTASEFTAEVDYFFSSTSRIAPEDGDLINLAVNVVGNGTVEIDPAHTSYLCNDLVLLTAIPDPGWAFSGWSDELDSSINPETILMDGSKAVTANFIDITMVASWTTYIDLIPELDLQQSTDSYVLNLDISKNAEPAQAWNLRDSATGDELPVILSITDKPSSSSSIKSQAMNQPLTSQQEGLGFISRHDEGRSLTQSNVTYHISNLTPNKHYTLAVGPVSGIPHVASNNPLYSLSGASTNQPVMFNDAILDASLFDFVSSANHQLNSNSIYISRITSENGNLSITVNYDVSNMSHYGNIDNPIAFIVLQELDKAEIVAWDEISSMQAQAKSIPQRFELEPNYPNPFNPSTTIRFSLPNSERVNLTVFDLQGRRIATLVNNTYQAGVHEVIWQGRDDSGRSVSSGIYMYRLQAGIFLEQRKMTLLK